MRLIDVCIPKFDEEPATARLPNDGLGLAAVFGPGASEYHEGIHHEDIEAGAVTPSKGSIKEADAATEVRLVRRFIHLF